MKLNRIRNLAAFAAFTSALYGQGYQRNAALVGGGNADQGKCTIEVVVDTAADIEVRGLSATLRNVSGQPAQWRRFECSSAIPVNPTNFSFRGIDGRGRQTLISDPRNGGVAVVRIEDQQGGSEGYTFDLTWGTRGQDYNSGGNVPSARVQDSRGPNYAGNGNPPLDRDRYNDGQYRPNYRDSDYYRRYNHGFGTQEAVRLCEREVLSQAARRFRGSEIHFTRTTTDDNPGRQDYVVGLIDVHRGPRGAEYGFSCSVDFDSGRMRSAELDLRPRDSGRR